MQAISTAQLNCAEINIAWSEQPNLRWKIFLIRKQNKQNEKKQNMVVV